MRVDTGPAADAMSSSDDAGRERASAKFARDPYLAPVVARWGAGAAAEAGWFDDGDDPSARLDDIGWLSTPTAHVRDGLGAMVADGGPPVVLLSTGGFFPLHDGHLAMMASARAAAEAAGWRVVGGYVSPGHDDYIAHKCGTRLAPIGASERIVAVAERLPAGGWLAVDPWEATSRAVAVCFTDVAARLEAYLRHHIDPGIEVASVFGGDNARFSLAFSERGRAVVVGRPGAEAEERRWRTDPRVAYVDRILWAAGGDPSRSTVLRPVVAKAPTRQLVVREEPVSVVAALGLDASAWEAFQTRLRGELAALVRVESVTVREASRPSRSTATATATDPVLSLDPLVAGTVDLGISRCFDLGGHHLIGTVARPGWPSLDRQLAAIPPGPYRLWDDDRATGATLAALQERLPADVVLASVEVGVDGRELDQPSDIADSRDFLLGTVDGGLVVQLPDGSLGRAPYLLPYVDPHARCGLPPDATQAFSAAVWRLAAATFEPTGTTVADLPPPARRTVLAAGRDPSEPLADLCAWHAETLRALALGAPTR